MFINDLMGMETADLSALCLHWLGTRPLVAFAAVLVHLLYELRL